MALDESLLMSAGAREQPATLRLFGWQPPALSLGFAQSHHEIDLQALEESGWDLVRRPTGGRAILHIDELTYSVTASKIDPRLSGSLLESYHQISRAILRALSILGVEANNEKEYPSHTINHQPAPVCFETPSNYEITSDGKKLVGSAQARKYEGILQHGSLPLRGDLARINRVIKFNDESKRELASEKLHRHATTLENVLGKSVTLGSVQEAFVQGFSEIFDIDFFESQPTDKEFARANDLLRSKYANSEWTYRL
jgi:lipoate-protein ligase A